MSMYNNKVQLITREGTINMDKKVSSYLNMIIRENANSSSNGLSLDVSEITPQEQENIVDYLFNNDPVTKEILLDRIQELIDIRIPLIESENNYDRGLMPIHDSQTGEVSWTRRI